MKTSIIGEWISQDKHGCRYRYIFNEDGTYTYATRNENEAWHIDHQGKFLYKENLLSLQYADSKWYNIGYVGIGDDEMIEGFKRTSAAGEGVEGEWVLDVSGMLFKGMSPCMLDDRFTVSFKDGNMEGAEVRTLNGETTGSKSFSGKYTVSDGIITISGAAEASTAYLTDGMKKICLIDGILSLIDDVTCNSYFKRVSGEVEN